MDFPRTRIRVCVIAFLVMFVLLSQAMFARVMTSAVPTPRITKKVDIARRTILPGHVSSAVHTSTDLGRQHAKTPSPGMLLILKSSEEQKQEIRKVIDEQQDKRTANYHQWMTPEEFGAHFGVHDEDIAQIKSWLVSEGFTVDEVSKSKRVIKFSGNIGQVEHAFQTEMHLYQHNGELHVANSRDISVPEALNKVIAGVTLNNFERKSSFDRRRMIKFGPKYTSSSSVHYVAPADFATIYNTAPLLANGINGSGQTIAIVGRSDILMSDVQTYRQLFNLPPNDPTFIHAGQDNGTEPGDDGESDLDVEISGGMAPNAHVDFVIGTPTFLVDGITNSVQYIVENNLADIMSISYGSCEAVEGAGGNEYNNQAFEQAAAQGISVFIASGDNGPVGCDNQNDSIAVLGYAAGAESSTPYSIAVGGTELAGECATFGVGCSQANYTKYWSASTNLLYLSSALEYIPEVPWNEGKGSNSNSDASSSLSGLWSSSGGISAYYLRPSWQQGANSPILTAANDPTYATYLAGSGGSITVQGGNWVGSVTLTNPGSGYTGSTTTVTITGGTCTTLPATPITANISGGSVAANGSLAQINFNNTSTTAPSQGLNCTVAPNVVFGAPTSGVTATGTVNLGPMTQTLPIISGVPHRLTPDFALNAADGHDATMFCSEGVCEFTTSATGQNTISDAGLVGGTSVAAPSMAGIQALINQANGGRQGMPGYVYYGLAAAQNNTTCAASALVPPNSANTTNCVFQDIQAGNTYICGTSTCTSSSGTKIGWPAGAGYDLATGLGSVNAYNMATQWSSVVFNSTTTTLNLSQTTFTHGTPITLSGTVSGSGTPTGDVAFIVSSGEIGVPVDLNTGAFAGAGAYTALSGGSFSDVLSNLPAGTYNVQARYAGDGTFASSLSAPVPVTVSGGEATTVTITPGYVDGTNCVLNQQSSFTYGQFIWTMVSVAGTSGQGVPTGSVTITLDGNNYTTVTLDPQGIGYLAAGTVPSSSCVYDYMFAQAPSIPGGSHNIGATYSGDATFASGTATPAAITVGQLTPTATLTVGATNLTSGFADPLTVTFGGLTALTGSGNLSSGPTGTVTFYNGATNLGTATVVPTVSFNANIYTYAATATTTSSLITASGTITAVYSGDASYAGVTTAGIAVTVGSDAATSTVVTSNGNPTTLNGRPTFTATVTSATSGAVTFYDGTAVLGAGSAVGTAHTSTFRPASGAAFWGGTHNITAVYGGASGLFAASTSAALVQTVTKGTNTINLACKQAGQAGSSFACSAVLTPSQTNATYAPNQGVVTFFDGATPVGTGVPGEFTSGQGGYGLWTASATTSALAAGAHTITATYSDINYGPGNTSNAVTVNVGNTSSGIYLPLPGSTLTSGTAAFRWYPVAGSSYWLDIGSTQGGNNYYSSGNMGSVLSATVSTLPTNGSTVWARLWYYPVVGGNWQHTDSSFTALNAAAAAAMMTSPTNTSTLTGSTVTFNWSAGASATNYWLDIGSSSGGNNYYSSGSLSTAILMETVAGLPTNGSTVYATLYSKISGNWVPNNYTYTAYNLAASEGVMSTPNPGSNLTNSTVTFTWTAGAGASAYWLDVGGTPGANNYSSSGNLGNVLTTTVSGLPTDGSMIYATLYSLIGGQWYGNTYNYTALNATAGLAAMQTPMPSTTISGTSATFTWSSDANATAYWVDIGSSAGGNDVYSSGNLGSALTTTVYTLPANSTTIYVSLYSYVGGQWVNNPVTYTSGP